MDGIQVKIHTMRYRSIRSYRTFVTAEFEKLYSAHTMTLDAPLFCPLTCFPTFR